jgi:hypothetical protein
MHSRHSATRPIWWVRCAAFKACAHRPALPLHSLKNGTSHLLPAHVQWHLGYVNNSCSPWARGFDSYVGYLNGNEGYYAHTVAGHVDFHECANGTGAASRTDAASLATPSFVYQPGALPSGQPSLLVPGGPEQMVNLSAAERLCGGADDCFGFTFEANMSWPVGPVKVYFTKELETNGDAHWQSYVRAELPPLPWPSWPPTNASCDRCTQRYEARTTRPQLQPARTRRHPRPQLQPAASSSTAAQPSSLQRRVVHLTPGALPAQ